VMQNNFSNGPRDEIEFDLTLDGLTVSARFQWDSNASGDDSLIVTPPDGIICYPADCVLTVRENDSGVLWLFSLEAVGM